MLKTADQDSEEYSKSRSNATKEAAQDLAGSIRVFSGNLWWGRADPDGLIDLIRKHRVDVFAAQELGHENAEAISSELPFGCLEPGDGFQGMGIALRRPGRYERIPLHFRDARRVVLEPSEWEGLERTLDLVNVHFQAPHAIRPFPSLRVRWRQARDLDRFFAENPSDARLVVGDYNATPRWPLYRRMARQFSDGAIHAAQREGRSVEATWGPRPGSRRLLRIDHAMVRGLDVERFRVVSIPGSDHSGLVFDCAIGSTSEVTCETGLSIGAPADLQTGAGEASGVAALARAACTLSSSMRSRSGLARLIASISSKETPRAPRTVPVRAAQRAGNGGQR